MKIKIILNEMKNSKMHAKKSLLIIGFLFVSNSFAQDANFHIYLCFGQSNMEGQGPVEQQDKTVDDRFQVFQALACSNIGRKKATWYPAVPPLCRCWNGLSPADYFGRTMVANLPENVKVGVVNVSIGGCPIELFDKDIYQDYVTFYTDQWYLDIISAYEGNPYLYLIDLAKLAQQDGVIKGILLHQGESNTGDNGWPEKVEKIYDDLMDDLDLDPDSVPLLAGEVVGADQGGICASMNSIIAKLPKFLPNSYVISSKGCTDKEDNIHFDSAGNREMGKRYAAQMLALMGYEISGIKKESLTPDGYVLKQNYPNPFNPSTSINYYLPRDGKVTLEVLDITGGSVRTLIDDVESVGEHQVLFDGSDLSSGIYLYRLTTSAGFVLNQKMLLVK